MTSLETNIFPITNLTELSSEYKLYRIKGLSKSQDEYYQNCQIIIERLSYRLQNPVTIIERDDAPHLVVLNTGAVPPQNLAVVRATVAFEQCPGVFKLDYSVRSPENDIICLRFLDFMIQSPLRDNKELWSPGAGQPFFKVTPDQPRDNSNTGELEWYSGFAVRATITPAGGLGLCIDVTSKAISKRPLPTHITHDEFALLKDKHVIYRYGYSWYEIQLVSLNDLNASEYVIQRNGKMIPLIEFAAQECEKPIPQELAQVPHDASVVVYMNNRGEPRGALAPLCYLVHGTNTQEAARQHGITIMSPERRRNTIKGFAQRYLKRIRFGNTHLQIADSPVTVSHQMFIVPDTRFGNSTILSVRGTPGTRHVSLDDLGNTRMALLRDRNVGFYNKDPLDRQYLILPQSVADSFGNRFGEDLKRAMSELYPDKYEPILITYNDRVPKTYAKQGNAILDAVQTKCDMSGYAVVMIHHTEDQVTREEDQLAAMVIAELRKRFDITAAVIHSRVGQESYRTIQQNGKSQYVMREEKRGLLSGYLRMVALNKVLLTSQRWPFVLETRLNADLTVGVDVKHNTVGLVIVGSNGADIRTSFNTSRQKEKLDARQMQAYLVEIIRREAATRSTAIKTIVLQRDGRIYTSEIKGIHAAMALLKREGMIDPDASITILELAKTSQVRFRLFDVGRTDDGFRVTNPQIGSYCLVTENEGYLCSTGRAFRRHGTAKPLYVRRVDGPLPLEKCLEDLYYLTVLAWSRPNDCSRYPITTKLNDRFLGEEATDYDTDALSIEAILEEENINE